MCFLLLIELTKILFYIYVYMLFYRGIYCVAQRAGQIKILYFRDYGTFVIKGGHKKERLPQEGSLYEKYQEFNVSRTQRPGAARK
jgi:hypothetical protein